MQIIDFTFLSDDDIPLRTPQRWRALCTMQKMTNRSQRLLNLLEPAPAGTTMQAIEDNALQGYLEQNEECLRYGLKARPHSMMSKEYVRYAMAGRTSRWVPVIEAGYSERCTYAYMPDSAKPECRSCEWPVEHIDHSVFCESCWAWIHLMCWQPHVTCHMLDKIGQKLTAENLERLHVFGAGDNDRVDLEEWIDKPDERCGNSCSETLSHDAPDDRIILLPCKGKCYKKRDHGLCKVPKDMRIPREEWQYDKGQSCGMPLDPELYAAGKPFRGIMPRPYDKCDCTDKSREDIICRCCDCHRSIYQAVDLPDSVSGIQFTPQMIFTGCQLKHALNKHADSLHRRNEEKRMLRQEQDAEQEGVLENYIVSKRGSLNSDNVPQRKLRHKDIYCRQRKVDVESRRIIQNKKSIVDVKSVTQMAWLMKIEAQSSTENAITARFGRDDWSLSRNRELMTCNPEVKFVKKPLTALEYNRQLTTYQMDLATESIDNVSSRAQIRSRTMTQQSYDTRVQLHDIVFSDRESEDPEENLWVNPKFTRFHVSDNETTSDESDEDNDVHNFSDRMLLAEALLQTSGNANGTTPDFQQLPPPRPGRWRTVRQRRAKMKSKRGPRQWRVRDRTQEIDEEHGKTQVDDDLCQECGKLTEQENRRAIVKKREWKEKRQEMDEKEYAMSGHEKIGTNILTPCCYNYGNPKYGVQCGRIISKWDTGALCDKWDEKKGYCRHMMCERHRWPSPDQPWLLWCQHCKAPWWQEHHAEPSGKYRDYQHDQEYRDGDTPPQALNLSRLHKGEDCAWDALADFDEVSVTDITTKAMPEMQTDAADSLSSGAGAQCMLLPVDGSPVAPEMQDEVHDVDQCKEGEIGQYV